MSITISEAVLTKARRRAAVSGYESVSDYVESLIESNDPSEAEEAEFSESLKQSAASIKEGRGRPLNDVFEELAKEFGIPWTRPQ